jgi:Ras-related protein Rab-7A
LFHLNTGRFATGKFSDLRRPTVGSDFLTKRINIHEYDVCLQIWDTAGQERFHQGTIGSSFYRGAHGALLVYDVNNEESTKQLTLWKDECTSHIEVEDYFPIVVVGNKVDIREATDEADRVDQSPVSIWCKENSLGHIETSAKDGFGGI